LIFQQELKEESLQPSDLPTGSQATTINLEAKNLEVISHRENLRLKLLNLRVNESRETGLAPTRLVSN
jgi:hypothetical protein